MCEFHLVRYYAITLLEVKPEWQIIENDEFCLRVQKLVENAQWRNK